MDHNYKFNSGTEFNQDLSLNIYETRFRGYDPSVGRFMQKDPLSELFADWNPYQYAYNAPVRFIDPLGLMNQENDKSEEEDEKEDNKTENLYKLINRAWYATKDGTSASYSISYNKYGGTETKREETSNGTAITFSGEYRISYSGGAEYYYTLDASENSDEFRYSRLGLGFGNTLYSLGQNLSHNKYFWLDSKGNFKSTKLLKLRPNGRYVWGVNGYRIGYANAFLKSKLWRLGSRYTVVGGYALSLYDGIKAYQNGDRAGMAKAGLDMTMLYISTMGPIGFAIGTTYFLVDTFYGIEQLGNDIQNLNPVDKSISNFGRQKLGGL